jgi:signal peptidase II
LSTPRSAEPLGRHRQRRLITVAVIATLVLIADQGTKTLAVEHLSNGPVHLIGPLSLVLAYNAGVAFSIGSGLTLPIIVIGLVIVALLFWFGRGAPSYRASIGIGLVLGGALGNLCDRLFRSRGGSVVDFIHTGFWPTFNLADSSIVGGCALMVIVFWRSGHHERIDQPS